MSLVPAVAIDSIISEEECVSRIKWANAFANPPPWERLRQQSGKYIAVTVVTTQATRMLLVDLA